MHISDPIERLKENAERWVDENIKGDKFLCLCGEWCNLEEGHPSGPNPYSSPICGGCVDKMIETLEIDYQNPFAIKIQTIVRGFLARKKMIYLKKVQTANKTTHSCCVCYNDLHSLNMSVTPCGHYYCSTCLFKWMNQKNTCAMCRTAL